MKPLKLKIIYFCILSFTLFCGIPESFSQPQEENKPSKTQREEIQKKIETVRLLRMIETLDLDEEQALKVNQIMKKHDKEQMQLQRSRKQHLRDLRKELRKESPNRQRVRSHTRKINSLDEKMPQIRKKESQEIGQHLNEVQQGKYLLFRKDFDRNVREILHERKRDQRQRRGNKNRNLEQRKKQRNQNR